jgi:Zn-dependent peptidase ImmA (M78 family)
MIIQKIEQKTDEILQTLKINTPDKIDLDKICNHFNIDVKSEKMDINISGLIVVKDNKSFIRYNTQEPVERKRFTIAHELGHFVLHKETPLFVDKGDKILYRDFNSSTGELTKEREANNFAASLLMPKRFLENELKKIPKTEKEPIEYLAKIFNVSVQAMSYRLSNLNYEIGYF